MVSAEGLGDETVKSADDEELKLPSQVLTGAPSEGGSARATSHAIVVERESTSSSAQSSRGVQQEVDRANRGLHRRASG